MSRCFRNMGFATFMIGLMFVTAQLFADITTSVVNSGLVTYDVDTEGPRAGGDYYGSGNDDAFGEFGITTFNFTPDDFGGILLDITSIELILTVNDRTFGDGGDIEFFFTPDTGAELDSGNGDFSALVFDHDFINGINNSQFLTAPVSLGVFNVAPTTEDREGEQDHFMLSFSGSALLNLMDSINNGTDFQIIIAAGSAFADVTYSGVGNNYDPGDPVLNITGQAVPEPSSMIALMFVGLVGFARRRRN